MSKKKFANFGERLRQLREDVGWPQRKVAALLDLDTSLLAKYERNERHPSRELIFKMADLFKVDRDELLNEVLSDKIAYQILEEEADPKILKVAEGKVAYLRKQDKQTP